MKTRGHVPLIFFLAILWLKHIQDLSLLIATVAPNTLFFSIKEFLIFQFAVYYGTQIPRNNLHPRSVFDSL